jgi:hypothetical protein
MVELKYAKAGFHPESQALAITQHVQYRVIFRFYGDKTCHASLLLPHRVFLLTIFF